MGDLEIEEDLAFQDRSWRAQRVAWVLMSCLLVLAMLGLFGTGPLSSATVGEPGAPIWVEYERFGKFRDRMTVRVHLGPGAARGAEARVWLDRAHQEAFRVEGVTSVSADVHKYGWCFKGASLLVHRDEDQLRRQYFLFDGWPGGLYGSATTAGTRPAAPIAAAWATVSHLGLDGYLRLADQVRAVARRFCGGIDGIQGIHVTGDPVPGVLQIAADTDPATGAAVPAGCRRSHRLGQGALARNRRQASAGCGRSQRFCRAPPAARGHARAHSGYSFFSSWALACSLSIS